MDVRLAVAAAITTEAIDRRRVIGPDVDAIAAAATFDAADGALITLGFAASAEIINGTAISILRCLPWSFRGVMVLRDCRRRVDDNATGTTDRRVERRRAGPAMACAGGSTLSLSDFNTEPIRKYVVNLMCKVKACCCFTCFIDRR